MAEPQRTMSSRAAWLAIGLLCLAILGMGLLVYALVGESPRTHQFQTLPDAPGESVYSTGQTPSGTGASPQLAPLPELSPQSEPAGSHPEGSQ